MGLLDLHKAERKDRILAAARRLIARRGFDRLTMRDLAEAARVSVPTVYNLIGGKHALLGELLSDLRGRVVARAAQEGDVIDGALALVDGSFDELEASPKYGRELVYLFLVRPELRAMRDETDRSNVMTLAGLLHRAQVAGQLVSWANPFSLACSSYALHMSVVIRWALGEMDSAAARAASKLGTALMLAGLVEESARPRLQELITELQPRAWMAAASGASRLA